MKLSSFLFLLIAILSPAALAQDDKVLELGKLTFQSCVACHGPDGKGVKAGDLQMAPTLHGSAFVNSGNSNLLTGIILKGILKEDNQYVQAMLSLEAALNDEQIAALIAYTTKEFGEKRQSPTANEVAKWRKEFASRKSPWKRSDLEEMIAARNEPRLLSDLSYSVYEGKWEELPDFSQLTPVKTGKLEDGLITLDPAKGMKKGFGMVFEGTLTLEKAGKFIFSITSDDGSAIALNGETLIGNDGIHPVKTAKMPYEMEAGTHTYKLLYFDRAGKRFLSAAIRKGKENIWLSTMRNEGQQKENEGYDPIPLTAHQPGEAIVHRAFLPDANPRAIAVGYPEAVNLVWDADTLNLAYVYRGDFMDAASHWNGRGSGSTPLGQDRVITAQGLPLQILESLDEPWQPTSQATTKYERDTENPEETITFNIKHPDYQFRGYRLDEKRYPTFNYQYRNLTISDRFDPSDVNGVTALVRTLTIEGDAEDNLYLRLADTGSQQSDNDWLDIGENLALKIEGSEPVHRQIEGKKETLVEVTGDSTVTVTYRWNTPLKP
ncbi:MAG: PA14 domain-containing protein [Verrucomicrobiales bacterium]|nr:PA14 domain-containing protein [Verrucomicrobiales bacterium]